MLAREGEDIPFLGVLTSGMIMAERGSEAPGPIRLLMPKEMIGRPDRMRSSYDLRVLMPSRICALPFASAKEYLDKKPEALIPFLSRSLQLIGTGREWIWLAYHHDAREKVAMFLAFILYTYLDAGLIPRDTPFIIPLPVTRSEIGTLLGLGLFTVSRHLNAFREERILDFSGGKTVTILKPDELFEIAGLTFEAKDQPAMLEGDCPIMEVP